MGLGVTVGSTGVSGCGLLTIRVGGTGVAVAGGEIGVAVTVSGSGVDVGAEVIGDCVLAFVATHYPDTGTSAWPHLMRTPALKVPSALIDDTNRPSVPKAEKALFSILLGGNAYLPSGAWDPGQAMVALRSLT